jgi:hypothetical protein
MNKSVKIVKLDIDELDGYSGVDGIALVEEPAIEENFIMFSKENKELFESYTDYPDAVSNNAKRGIELNEKVNNKCATQVGKVRAQQLANKEAISVETIKRMYSYLSRAEEYYDESDTEACGTISYLLWGGLAAKRWSEAKLKELGLFEGAVDVSALPNYVNEPSGSLIVKDIFVKPRASETENEFISRCMDDLNTEYPDDSQRAAVCYSYWNDKFEQEQIGEYLEGLFSFLGYIDGLPVFSTPEEASEVAQVAGCEGYHEHQVGDFVVYMPCQSHEPEWDDVLQEAYDEWRRGQMKSWNDLTDEQKEELIDYLKSVGEEDVLYDQETFAVTSADAQPNEESITDSQTSRIRYKYSVLPGKGAPKQSNTRSFCKQLIDLGLLFRKEDINNLSLKGANPGFGPDGSNSYDIFQFAGGNNCRHYWKSVRQVYNPNTKKWVRGDIKVQEATTQDTKSSIGILGGTVIGGRAIGESFAKSDAQRIIAGPLMVPDKLIYRIDEYGNEYYVYFSDDTIKKIAYKYQIEKRQDTTNLEHNSNVVYNDVVLVETWLVVDPNNDKSKALTGKEYPKGTWFGMMKVNNDTIWNEYVLTGLVKGFSVEGFFADKLINETRK